MPSYITRIELHNAQEEDYFTLDSVMEAEGFKRTVDSDAGVAYQLPKDEYYAHTDLNRSQVLEKAIEGATKTGKEFAVLVSQADGIIWRGLAEKHRPL